MTWIDWFENVLPPSRLLGCYCHHDYLCRLVKINEAGELELAMLKNVNKLQNVERCRWCWKA